METITNLRYRSAMQPRLQAVLPGLTPFRLSRILVVVLFGVLFLPVVSVTSPQFMANSEAATTTYNCSVSGSVSVSSPTTSTFNACTGSVDLSASGLTELNGTFMNKTSVTAVKLPNTLQVISGFAFYNTGIAKLTLPPSITSICSQCISNNQKLTSLEMSGSAAVSVSLSGYALGGNPKLTTVSFGYTASTSLNLTNFASNQFLFQDDLALTTIISCAAPSSYLATFLAGDNQLDGNTPKRKNIATTGANNPTVSCIDPVSVTGGGTARVGSSPYPIIYSYTGSISGTTATLNVGTIQATATNLSGVTFYVSTDNYTFAEITACANTDSTGIAAHICNYSGLTIGNTYYFRAKALGKNGYDQIYSPDITITVPAPPPAPTLASATITGTAQVGTQLTAVPGAITGSGTSTTYQWQSSLTASGTYTNIASATASTYTPVSGDAGNFIKVSITVTNSGGSDSKIASATSAVLLAPPTLASAAITGTPQAGLQLTAVPGAITGSSTSTTYQWQSSPTAAGTYTNIASATASMYTPISGDIGNFIKVVITVTNNGGSSVKTSASTNAIRGAALNPIFDTATPTTSGFTLQIGNWDPTFTWTGTNSGSGTVAISGSGLITVTGINPGTASTVTVQTLRTGYDTGTATSSSIRSINGSALTPTFDTATSTSNGFTLQIKNYDSAFTWTGTNSIGKPTTIGNTGLITVTGVNPGTFSTVTIQTTRTGYETGTAVSSSIKSINGSALTPVFSTETGTATGFLLQISNFDAAYTWSGTNSLAGSVSINNSTGLITVTGIAPGTYSTLTIQATRSGFETGTATSASFKSNNGASLTPSFSTETGTATGFQLQLSNFDASYTWSGTNSLGGTVSIAGTGLITVTGVNPGTSSTVTITTSRTGYDTGTATSSSYASITGSARSPGFGAATSTADGFTLPITNFDSNYTWSATNSLGKTVTINGTTGLITVTGVNPGTASTVTVRSTRTGYETGTATSSAISSLTGAAKVPTFGSPTSTVDGFTLPITNYETSTTWSVTNSLGKSVSINSTTGLITVTGVNAGTLSSVTVRTTRTGYETGTATSDSISSATAATQPTEVSATTAARSAVVSWTAPSDTGGIAITNYAVEYSSTNGETWTAFAHTPSSLTNLTVTGLLDGTSYLYRVAAINAAGQSPFSTSSAVISSYYVTCTSGSFWVAGPVIPSAAGANCTGTAIIPVGITGVAINAFAPGSAATQTNRALTSIVFPATGFVNIDQGGFRNLGLINLTIPTSVTMVGLSAFENNPLTTVTITGGSGGASTYLSEGAFNNQNASFGLSTSIALTFGSGKIDIGFNFGTSTRFSTVDFGSGLNSIDETAFKQNGISPGWIPLFPSSITSIGKDAFTHNPSLSTIRFGSSITSSITAIDNAAFDPAYIKSVQYCGPSGTVLSNYLKNRLSLAKVWCDFVAPNAPTISSSSKTTQQVTIGWTKGIDRSEPPTDTFTVQYQSNGGAWTSVAYDPTTPLSSTIRNLTNGTTYSFRVAANNIAGASSFSNVIQVTPLGPSLIPTFDTSTAVANGFTFNITNYDSRTAWSATVTAGTGTVTLGTPSGSRLPVIVSGMNSGATVSIQITTTRSTYETGTANTAGTSLNAALSPTFGAPSITTNGYSVPISNFDSNFTWSVSTSAGTATITAGSIVVTGVNFATSVTETVTATQSNYITGSSIFSATTLAGLTATYFGNGNTGGVAPSDTATYQTNGSVLVLGNTGALQKPGYTFSGWNLNSGNTGATYLAGDTFTLANAGISFYAKWVATPYSVTYHATEATAGAVPSDPGTYIIATSANIRGNAGALQRTGYVFAGWADNANRTGKIYKSGDTYTVQTNDLDFYAAWTPNTYAILFNANGATGSPSKTSDSYTVDSSTVQLPTIGTLQNTGYNFGGWGTQSVGGLVLDSLTVTSDTTLYAQWNIASFNLTYSLDGGTGSIPSTTSVSYLQQFNLAPSTGFTKSVGADAYAFVAWSGPSGTYNPGQSYYMPASDLTFTATWTRIYNVKYSFSGGSVGSNLIADEQKLNGETITVTSTQPTRTGYDFIGWIDQSGESATAAALYTVRDGHYLLFAQWSATPYTVTYDAAGGSPAPTQTPKTIGQSFTIGAAPTKTGYNFKGWRDGTNTFAAGAPYVTQSSNIVLTAQWEAQTYVVSYDLNAGSGDAGGNHSFTYGTSAYLLPTSGFSRTDYNFGGWATAPGGPSVGSTFEPSSNITLYAIWNIAIYRLSFDGQSGYSDSATAKVTIGQSLILPSGTRAGYTLQGWSTQQSGGSITAGGASFTPASDGTLYAQWALQVFTVTYIGNGGMSETPTATLTNGSTVPLVLPNAVRSNYVFAGWYLAAVGGYSIGLAGANFLPTNSVTIYAHWIQASLEGLGVATKIAEVTVHTGFDNSFSAGSNGSSATVNYTADSLPDGTVITAYVQGSTDRASSLIDPTSTYLLSLVVAWVAPDGTVPNTADGKPIVVTITNNAITKGSRVYGLIGTTPRYLGTATQDKTVQVSLTQDPTVTVAITRPDPATAVSAVAIDDVSALITWSAPEVSGGSAITEYAVSTSAGQSCTSTTTSCVVSGLTASTSYTFTVLAKNAIGLSDQSAQSASITTAATQTQNSSGGGNSGGGNSGGGSASVAQGPATVVTQTPASISSDLQAAQAAAAAELQAARDQAEAAAKAANDAVAQAKAAADSKAAAEAKALADAALAAQLAAQKITPDVTLYSISPKLTLSAFDLAYLKKYVSTLKKTATVTCIGYTYTLRVSLTKATVLAKQQANAVCSIIKKTRPSLKTTILIRPSKLAPSAAQGAKWVAISYRIDGYQLKK